MPKYKYTAYNLTTKKVSGEIDARDEADLRRLLRAQDLVPQKYSIVVDKSSSYRMKSIEVAEFSRQLAGMLASGITIVRAMEILKERDFLPKLLKVYDQLHRDVQQGQTISEAMRLQGKTFPEMFINMFTSGEASGQLEQVASKMAIHYEKEHRLNSKAKSAMTYPMILLVTTVAVIMLLFTMILPNFFEMLEGMELPTITLIMLGISNFLQELWYVVIIAFLVLIFAWQSLLRLDKVKFHYDRIKLKLKVIGKLLVTIYTARFARTLSSLYSSGIPMLRALEITATIVNNKYIADQFPDVITDVRNGEPLSASIGKVDGFDKKLATTIMIGEESGRLDAMLEATAESFDYEAEVALDKLVQLIQPVMIVILAGVIGSVMLSVMLPMMTLYEGFGG
ncbi:MAG: type II secretion system F family protein [Oscillospiraceae bacterium]|jgi:type IV pilus assembly protein PilC|nr:type II secretion system F family protein [Oscillospiraceae bacterium]